MATQVYPVADFDADNVIINILYDDVNLSITAIQFQNTSPFNALVTWNGHSDTLPANTPLTTASATKYHEKMVQITNARGVATVTVPGGDVSCQWPSP